MTDSIVHVVTDELSNTTCDFCHLFFTFLKYSKPSHDNCLGNVNYYIYTIMKGGLKNSSKFKI